MNKDNVTMFVRGAVVGCILISVAMFATGWVVRSDNAEKNARSMAQDAVAESLAKVCVAQFEAAPDKAAKLVEMKKFEGWQRGKFVIEQGWATMPGSDGATSRVADACATMLGNLPG